MDSDPYAEAPFIEPGELPGNEPAEQLLPDEIPKRAFAKGGRPKRQGPEAAPPPEATPGAGEPAEPSVAGEETAEEPASVMEAESAAEAPLQVSKEETSAPRGINPLNLYFHSPAPTPEARAKAFVTWVRETADAEAAFVVDGYGAAIASEPETDSVFLASLSNLADALGRGRDHFSRPDQSAVHLEMAEGQILCVVQAKWDVATVALALIRATPLPREMAVRYRQELAKLAQKPRRRPRD
jgi:hypothetical protein